MKKIVLIRLEYPGIMGMDSGECRRKGTAINGVVQVMKRSVKFERDCHLRQACSCYKYIKVPSSRLRQVDYCLTSITRGGMSSFYWVCGVCDCWKHTNSRDNVCPIAGRVSEHAPLETIRQRTVFFTLAMSIGTTAWIVLPQHPGRPKALWQLPGKPRVG